MSEWEVEKKPHFIVEIFFPEDGIYLVSSDDDIEVTESVLGYGESYGEW